MKPIVYMVCGVPGSGKSWVCEQLTDKFIYISHDLYLKDLVPEIVKQSIRSDIGNKPFLIDCPFGERKLRESLEELNFEVIPLFIIEDPETVKRRYEARENKPFSKSNYTRCTTIAERAIEWNAVSDTSEGILVYLRELNNGIQEI